MAKKPNENAARVPALSADGRPPPNGPGGVGRGPGVPRHFGGRPREEAGGAVARRARRPRPRRLRKPGSCGPGVHDVTCGPGVGRARPRAPVIGRRVHAAAPRGCCEKVIVGLDFFSGCVEFRHKFFVGHFKRPTSKPSETLATPTRARLLPARWLRAGKAAGRSTVVTLQRASAGSRCAAPAPVAALGVGVGWRQGNERDEMRCLRVFLWAETVIILSAARAEPPRHALTPPSALSVASPAPVWSHVVAPVLSVRAAAASTAAMAALVTQQRPFAAARPSSHRRRARRKESRRLL